MEKQSQCDLEAENKRYKLLFFPILIDKTLKSIHLFLYLLNLRSFLHEIFPCIFYIQVTQCYINASKRLESFF